MTKVLFNTTVMPKGLLDTHSSSILGSTAITRACIKKLHCCPSLVLTHFYLDVFTGTVPKFFQVFGKKGLA